MKNLILFLIITFYSMPVTSLAAKPDDLQKLKTLVEALKVLQSKHEMHKEEFEKALNIELVKTEDRGHLTEYQAEANGNLLAGVMLMKSNDKKYKPEIVINFSINKEFEITKSDLDKTFGQPNRPYMNSTPTPGGAWPTDFEWGGYEYDLIDAGILRFSFNMKDRLVSVGLSY